MSTFIGTATWTRWFAHPARIPTPQATIEGARLWRVMLLVAAAGIVLLPWTLQRLCAGGASTSLAAPPRDRGRLGIVIGLVALGLLLRATRLTESLWYDEIAWYLSYGNSVDSPLPILGNYFDPVNHVLHTALGWMSVRAFSNTLGVELSFRLPALAFSLASIVAMEGLGRASGGGRIGLFAALAAAAMPVMVLEGGESRGYSMMICFAAIMTRTLLEARSENRPWLWVAYAMACALGIWTHFVTAFVPLGHAAWLTWTDLRRGERKRWLIAMTALAFGAILTITLLAPLLPDFLHQRGVFFTGSGTDQPTILGTEGFHALLQLGGSWYWWAAIPGWITLILGLGKLIQQRRSESDRPLREAVILSFAGLPPMALAIVLGGSWIYARFTLFAMPGTMLLLAVGLDRLWRLRPRIGAIALAATLAAWFADLSVRPPKQPLREAAAYVRAHRAEHDRLLEIGLAHGVNWLYAGDLKLDYVLRHGKDLPELMALDMDLSCAAREAALPEWIIVEYPHRVSPEIYRLLEERDYRTVARFRGWADWTQGDVIVMHRDIAYRIWNTD